MKSAQVQGLGRGRGGGWGAAAGRWSDWFSEAETGAREGASRLESTVGRGSQTDQKEPQVSARGCEEAGATG